MSAVMRRNVARPFIVDVGSCLFLLAFASIFLIEVVLRPSGEDGLRWFSDVTQTTMAIGGGLATVFLASAISGRERRSWLLLGAAILSWGLGQAVWSYYELFLTQETPFPSFADIGYLAMIPLAFAGLI